SLGIVRTPPPRTTRDYATLEKALAVEHERGRTRSRNRDRRVLGEVIDILARHFEEHALAERQVGRRRLHDIFFPCLLVFRPDVLQREAYAIVGIGPLQG